MGGWNSLRWDRWLVAGVVLLLLGAVAVPQAFVKRSEPQGQPIVDIPATRPSRAGEYRGITLQLHASDPKVPFEKFVEEIARTGANTICLSVAAYQENASSSSLFIESRKAPTRERTVQLIQLARERGLRVVVMPIVLLENARGGEWRGLIVPPDPNRWWEDYENYILHYARIAQEGGAEVLMVGSELVQLEKETTRWRALIGKARKAFAGKLSYSANWDHYEGIEWWRDLDLVGMTVYYDLVGDKEPSLDVLLAAWRPIRKDVLAWRSKINMPILFTEVGWPSQEGCAKAPWNYVASRKADVNTQDLCFQAFFRTWAGGPGVAGVLIWEWRNQEYQTGGPEDVSYIPIGKPAMATIQRYFQAPDAVEQAKGSPAPDAPAQEPAVALPDPGKGQG